MSKSQEKVITGLKLRAQPKEGALSLRLGVRKVVLPFQVKLLASDDYLFVHLPSAAEIFKFEDKEIVLIDSLEEAQKASASFRKTRKAGTAKPKTQVALPGDLLSALAKVPDGYKIGYDAAGNPKLVRKRNRGGAA